MFRYAIEINNNLQAELQAAAEPPPAANEEASAASGTSSDADAAAETAANADTAIKLLGVAADLPYGNELLASKRLCRMLRNGVVAVLGPNAPPTALHTLNICDAKEIPYVDYRSDADTRPPVINMQPHPDAMAQLFVDLIVAWDWQGFTILYESAPWLPRVAELLKLNDPKEYTITARHINAGLTDANYRSVLRRVRLASDTQILVHCSIDVLPEVLKQAQQVGLMTDAHQFIVTTPDMHTIDLEPYQYSGVNITGVRMVNPENPLVVQVTGFIADALRQAAESKSEAEGGGGEGGGGAGGEGGGGEGGGDNEDEEGEDGEGDGTEDAAMAEVPPGLTAEQMRTQTALIFDSVLLLTEALKQLNAEQILPKKLNCNNMESWEHGNSITNFMRNVS